MSDQIEFLYVSQEDIVRHRERLQPRLRHLKKNDNNNNNSNDLSGMIQLDLSEDAEECTASLLLEGKYFKF